MFAVVSAMTIVPVLYLGHLPDSFAEVLIGGFFLGLGGTTFLRSASRSSMRGTHRPGAVWPSGSSELAWVAPRSRRSAPCSSPTRTDGTFRSTWWPSSWPSMRSSRTSCCEIGPTVHRRRVDVGPDDGDSHDPGHASPDSGPRAPRVVRAGAHPHRNDRVPRDGRRAECRNGRRRRAGRTAGSPESVGS